MQNGYASYVVHHDMRSEGKMSNVSLYAESRSRPVRRTLLAVVLFSLAAALTVAAVAGSDVAPTPAPLAAPAAPGALPDWHGNSAQLPPAR
jgi:hypothetical protein